MAAAYCMRSCCCDAAAAACCCAAAAADELQKLASHSAVSRSKAVMSTPRGTRPRARQASTCARSSSRQQ